MKHLLRAPVKVCLRDVANGHLYRCQLSLLSRNSETNRGTCFAIHLQRGEPTRKPQLIVAKSIISWLWPVRVSMRDNTRYQFSTLPNWPKKISCFHCVAWLYRIFAFWKHIPAAYPIRCHPERSGRGLSTCDCIILFTIEFATRACAGKTIGNATCDRQPTIRK